MFRENTPLLPWGERAIRREETCTTNDEDWLERVAYRCRWFFFVWVAAVWLASLYAILGRSFGANFPLMPEVLRAWLR